MRSKYNPRGMQRARRSGVSMYLFAGSLPVLMGMTGLVVDLAHLYTHRAEAQRAADAAALAGAIATGPDTPTQTNASLVIQTATDYALKNGYDTTKGDTVIVNPTVAGVKGVVQVTLGRSEEVYFIPVLEALIGRDKFVSRQVFAHARAEKVVNAALNLGGNYGMTDGVSNPSAFGPYGDHGNGDPYSVLYYSDGTPNDTAHLSHNAGDSSAWDQNSKYDPDGFTYSMNVSDSYAAQNGTVRLQLYDPDCYNGGTASLDEIRPPSSKVTDPSGQKETTTKYTIFKVANDGSLQQVATATYGGTDADKQYDAAVRTKAGLNPWVTPSGFDIPLATYGSGQYKVRVQTTDGSSENGYNLRAGPPSGSDESETQWNKDFGDNGGTDPSHIAVPIVADGKLQMNYTRGGHVKVRLGYLPADVAGSSFDVVKFDTDVGSTSIKYTTDGLAGFSQNGVLDPKSDDWSKDTVNVPKNFTGGYWYAEYDAGEGDTSSWAIRYTGTGSGFVRLIQ